MTFKQATLLVALTTALLFTGNHAAADLCTSKPINQLHPLPRAPSPINTRVHYMAAIKPDGTSPLLGINIVVVDDAQLRRHGRWKDAVASKTPIRVETLKARNMAITRIAHASGHWAPNTTYHVFDSVRHRLGTFTTGSTADLTPPVWLQPRAVVVDPKQPNPNTGHISIYAGQSNKPRILIWDSAPAPGWDIVLVEVYELAAGAQRPQAGVKPTTYTFWRGGRHNGALLREDDHCVPSNYNLAPSGQQRFMLVPVDGAGNKGEAAMVDIDFDHPMWPEFLSR